MNLLKVLKVFSFLKMRTLMTPFYIFAQDSISFDERAADDNSDLSFIYRFIYMSEFVVYLFSYNMV